MGVFWIGRESGAYFRWKRAAIAASAIPTANSSGSNSSPIHSICSARSGCAGSARMSRLLITPSPAAILWWTVALSADAGRIGRRLTWRRAFFDDDGMFPVVAEVVGMGEAGDAGF